MLIFTREEDEMELEKRWWLHAGGHTEIWLLHVESLRLGPEGVFTEG